MKIFIAADHGGFELKAALLSFIKETFNFEIEDLGAVELNPTDDYPLFAKALSDKIIQNPDTMGILICRSGIGMSITANRHFGIFAALCTSEEQASISREHNNANVLCLDSEFISEEINKQIVSKFLTTQFTNDERHLRRLNEINNL